MRCIELPLCKACVGILLLFTSCTTITITILTRRNINEFLLPRFNEALNVKFWVPAACAPRLPRLSHLQDSDPCSSLVTRVHGSTKLSNRACNCHSDVVACLGWQETCQKPLHNPGAGSFTCVADCIIQPLSASRVLQGS